VKRARYSALTKEEIERAFSELDELSFRLRTPGWARARTSTCSGAPPLTRAVSLATRRFGSNFLSVGRVQSPTLALVVERELERRAHKAEPYWRCWRTSSTPTAASRPHHETDKFWKRDEGRRRVAGTKSPGMVKEVASRRNTRKPPTPYNTTAFTTDASSRLGSRRRARCGSPRSSTWTASSPTRAPTTPVYPSSLPVSELVRSLANIPDFEAAKPLLDGQLQPTRPARKETPPAHHRFTDSYPTQAVSATSRDRSSATTNGLAAATPPSRRR